MKLLFFKQPSCTPCQAASNFIEHELQVKPDETLMLFSGDKRADELAQKFFVMTTPTLLLVNDEETEVIKMVRGASPVQIEEIFVERGLI